MECDKFGLNDGSLAGAKVGCPRGVTVGASDGSLEIEGFEDGLLDRITDGDSDGFSDDRMEGILDGPVEVISNGWFDGVSDKNNDGLLEDKLEGLSDGDVNKEGSEDGDKGDNACAIIEKEVDSDCSKYAPSFATLSSIISLYTPYCANPPKPNVS